MICGKIKASDFLGGKSLRDCCFEYLEALRESGKTNMFGATPYLQREFDMMDEKSAKAMLVDWMKNRKECD